MNLSRSFYWFLHMLSKAWKPFAWIIIWPFLFVVFFDGTVNWFRKQDPSNIKPFAPFMKEYYKNKFDTWGWGSIINFSLLISSVSGVILSTVFGSPLFFVLSLIVVVITGIIALEN